MNKKIKNILITIAFPLAMYLLMECAVYALTGGHLIASELDIKNLIRSTGISAATAIALSMNLTSGRMDLSLGAQRLFGTIMGGVIAQSLGLGGIWVMIFAVIMGFVGGGLVGYLFVTLRIPPMVLGIGMACIYECIGSIVTGGRGLRLANTAGVELLSDSNFTIAVLILMIIAIWIILTYTKFSYDFRAVQGNQKIAREAGVNVFKNVFICYVLAGILVVIGGVLETAFGGSMDAATGLTSSGSVMSGMFAMSLGMYMAKWSNQPIGIVVATLTLKFFTTALTAFSISNNLNNSIQMILFLVFLVFSANKDVLKVRKHDEARKKLAIETKEKMQSGVC
jgi:Ribose/xylose/arabinose/galactoside ABC-type transport systems, permease components